MSTEVLSTEMPYDWDGFVGLLESQKLRNERTKLLSANFLIVKVLNSMEEVIYDIAKSHIILLKDSRVVTIIDNDRFLDVGEVIKELNCSDKIKYLILSYQRIDKGKEYGALIQKALNQNKHRLMRCLPKVLVVPWPVPKPMEIEQI